MAFVAPSTICDARTVAMRYRYIGDEGGTEGGEIEEQVLITASGTKTLSRYLVQLAARSI